MESATQIKLTMNIRSKTKMTTTTAREMAKETEITVNRVPTTTTTTTVVMTIIGTITVVMITTITTTTSMAIVTATTAMVVIKTTTMVVADVVAGVDVGAEGIITIKITMKTETTMVETTTAAVVPVLPVP